MANIFGDRRKLVVIFAVALVARLIYLVTLSGTPGFEDLIGDSLFYDSWAKSILNESFFSNTAFYNAPLYPYFVSALYAISGGSRLLAAIIQIVIGSLSCVLLYLIARRFFSEKAALAAGIVASLYGVFVYLDAEMVPNALAMFLLLAGVFMLSVTERKSRLRHYLLAGVFIGLASITRPSLILFCFMAVLWLVFSFRAKASWKLTRWGVLLLGAAAVILPVTIHNAVRSGDFVLISANLGVNLLAGNNTHSDGKTAYLPGQRPDVMWDFDSANKVAEERTGRTLSPAETSAFYAEQAWRFVETSPKEAIGLLVKRAYMILNGYEVSADRPFYLLGDSSWFLSILIWDNIISFPMGIIVPLFIVGIAVTASNWRKLSLVYCFLVSMFIWPALFFVNVQTRAPVAFPIIMFAPVGLLAAVRFTRKKDHAKVISVAAIGLVSLLIFNYDLVELSEKPQHHYLQIGLTLWNEGRYDDAEKAFKAGLEIDPNSTTLLNNLGNVYYRKRIYQEAEKKYRRALVLDPGFIDARRNLIRLYERWERKDILYEAYSEFLHFFPNSKWGLFRIAEYFVNERQDDSALVYYDRLLALDPDDPDARFGLASVYLRVGRAEEARKTYEGMLQIYPEEPKLHLNLGLAYLQLGKELLAEDEFTTVLYYDSSNTFALYNLARLFETRGDSAMATSLFLRIMTIDPGFFENSEEILDSLLKTAEPYEKEDWDAPQPNP